MRRRLIAFGATTFSSLAIRNYRLYFIGQGISITGTWMQGIAMSWLVLHLTGSGTALGAVTALQFAPTLLIGLWAGKLADRFPKRTLLICTQTAAGLFALALGIAVAFDFVTLPLIFVLAAGLGIVNALDTPARLSFVHDLVGPDALPSAIGLNSAEVNLGRIIGPAIAGILIATVGLAACFIVNAVSFLAVIVSLFMVRHAELHLGKVATGEGASVRAGLAYARRTPSVLAPVLMMLLIGIFTFEFSVSLPLMARFAFHGGAGSLGWLMSGMGVGAMVGGIITASRREDGVGRLAWAALVFGVTTGLAAFAPTLAIAVVVMVLVGVFSARFTALSNTVLQLQSEPQMRSRVMAMWSVAFLGSSLIGGPLVGYLGERFGAPWSLAVAGVGGVLAALVGWWGYRRSEGARSRGADEPVLEPQ